MSKILHFHFQKSIFGSFSNSFSFFFIVKQQIFSVWRFSTANFQAFIFFNFVFMKIFFRLNFVKFKCEFFSDFWRIKIQNFKRNFFRQLHTTKKYWRSAGNSKNFSSRIHKRSRCFFRLTKLWKKTIWKAAAKENFTNSMQNSSPHFANIMLHEAPFHCFYSNFRSFFR